MKEAAPAIGCLAVAGLFFILNGARCAFQLKARPSGDIADIYVQFFSIGSIILGSLILLGALATWAAAARKRK